MGSRNQTSAREFIFLSITNNSQMQVCLFLMFIFLYSIIILGNVSILTLVWTDRRLHTPMYFFLANLSFFEFCYTCSVVPKMLSNFLVAHPTITMVGCSFQMYFFACLGSVDCFLLAVMSFDRYLAICNPLRYSTIMSMRLCFKLVVVCVILGFMLSLELVIYVSQLPFCDNHLQHFFCELPVVLTLVCIDTSALQAALFSASVLVLTVPFLLISISYGFIISTVMRIPSAQGRRKAFSTCTSHITVVLLQYGVVSFMYLRPTSMHSPDLDRLLALVYVFGTPMLNPLIYTLRNKDMKRALTKLTRNQAGVTCCVRVYK